MPEDLSEAIYTITLDADGNTIAALLLKRGMRTGIYSKEGHMSWPRLIEHEQIVTRLHEMGYRSTRYVSEEDFNTESIKQQLDYIKEQISNKYAAISSLDYELSCLQSKEQELKKQLPQEERLKRLFN